MSCENAKEHFKNVKGGANCLQRDFVIRIKLSYVISVLHMHIQYLFLYHLLCQSTEVHYVRNIMDISSCIYYSDAFKCIVHVNVYAISIQVHSIHRIGFNVNRTDDSFSATKAISQRLFV